MGVCLVTTLKGNVTDTSLETLGEMRFKVKNDAATLSEIVFHLFGATATLEILSDGYFTDSTGTSNFGKTKAIGAHQNVGVTVSAGEQELSLKTKYPLFIFANYGKGATIEIDTSDLLGCVYLRDFVIKADGIRGSLKDIMNCGSNAFSNFNLNANHPQNHPYFDCNIDDFEKSNHGPSTVNFGWVGNCYGDIANLPTGIVYAVLYNTKVTGNLSSISDRTALTNLDLRVTNVEGNLSSLSTLTNLQSLYVDATEIAGDTSDLAPLTKLTTFSYTNCPNITGTWPLT